jgi:hypothetical protein
METDDDLDLNDLSPIKEKKKKIKRSFKKSEESEQVQFIRYLRNTHPNVLWRASPEGIRLSIGQATKLKRSGLIQKGMPDLEIFHPTSSYHGLFIEMKKIGTKIRNEKGDLYKDKHLHEQVKILEKLNSSGYFASFGIGFIHAKQILDLYMSNDVNELNKIKII